MSSSDDDDVGLREWFVKTLKKTLMYTMLSVLAFGMVTLALYYSTEILALTQYAKELVLKPPS